MAKGKAVPAEWSVVSGKNIRWRTPLPNGGQSGIAVWGDRLFLTTFAAGEKGFSSRWLMPVGGCTTGRRGNWWRLETDQSN